VNVQVTVEFFGVIRDRIRDPQEVLSLPPGQKVRDLVERLIQRHGSELRTELLAPKGEPLPNVVLTLDGQRIADSRGMDKEIRGDTVLRVLLMPPFTGGG
jgi:molybdopterin converting factor small subunit